MLAIRMQRTGRKGHAQFRVVVQDSRRTPTSGRIVAALGHFNPHSKEAVINKEKASFYLEHGAQPSDRVARLLKAEGVKLPKWVELESNKKRDIRNAEKLRKNQPKEETKAEEPAPVEEVPAEPADVSSEALAKGEEQTAEAPAEQSPAEEPAEAKKEA